MRLIIKFLWMLSMMPARLFWLHWLPSVLLHELVGYVLFSKKSRPEGQILQSYWWFVLSKFILHAVLCGKMIGRSLGVSECYSARCTGLGEKEGFWQILSPVWKTKRWQTIHCWNYIFCMISSLNMYKTILALVLAGVMLSKMQNICSNAKKSNKMSPSRRCGPIWGLKNTSRYLYFGMDLVLWVMYS